MSLASLVVMALWLLFCGKFRRHLPVPEGPASQAEVRVPDAATRIIYQQGVSTGAIRAALTHTSSAPGAPKRGVDAREGWLEVSTPDGRAGSFERLWAQLEPASRLLLLFRSEAKAPGSERAVVDMLSADIFDVFPTPDQNVLNAPQPPSPSAQIFWLTVEDAANPDGTSISVFGRGPGRTATCTALVCASAEDKAGWLLSLAQARDSNTMHMPSEEEKANAPILSTSLLHNQLGASFFSSLGSVVERKVIVVPAKKQLSIYSDVKGTKLAAVLELSADCVRFVFHCDDRSPQPAFSNLRVEITAPQVASRDRALQVHNLRARNSAEFGTWAAALAAL